MKKTVLLCALLIAAEWAVAQLNMTLVSQVQYSQSLSDVWGWVDPDDSTEYALVGTRTGLSIVSLADPSNPEEVAFAPGANSTWRDIKSWGNHVYVTNESANGLMVVDMTHAPDSITWYDWTPDIPGLGTLQSCHNLYIDEFGYCYLAGCNLNGGGVLIVDVFSDPGNPQYVSAAPAVYSHDVYARDNRLYSSQIFAGTLGIYDVSDKQNIQLLATQQTPFNFTHNAWLNDAGDVVFTTDEQAAGPVAAYDISDLNDIKLLDTYRPIATLGQGVIPHNVHVWNNWLIISYYTDGGIVVDADKPDNLIEVGNFDTFFGGGAGFSGAWGAYPFFPSGLVLVSDIGNGLYVLEPNYVRACYLEGRVTDAVTHLPIAGAQIVIDSSQPNLGETDANGEYKTGQAIPGTFDVTFSANGYQSKTLSAELVNGQLTILDAELEPLSSFAVSGMTIKGSDGTPIPGAKVLLVNDAFSFEATTDADGNFSFPGVFGGTYTLYAGAWGYRHASLDDLVVDDQTQPIVVALDFGYQDDFILNFEWETSATASTGHWERGEPIGTNFNGNLSNPDEDVPDDLGDQCYVTGNGGGGAGNDDVDNGEVILTSPSMDLTTYDEPVIRFSYWFFNDGGNGSPDDALEVRLSNGSTEVLLASYKESASEWKDAEFQVSSFIEVTDDMRITFFTSDLPGSGHLVEAAVDAFRVEEASGSTLMADFSADVQDGCAPLTVQFSDASVGNPSGWSWSFPGGNPDSSTEPNPSVSYEQPGTYSVTLEVSNDDGQTSTVIKSQFIRVLPEPTADFSFSLNGGTATFTNLSQNADSYLWDFGDGSTSSDENPTHEYTATGEYTVSLTVTNECGQNTFSQTVNVVLTSTRELDPDSYRLQAFPNPFHSTFTLRYEVQKSAEATLLLTDRFGRTLRRLLLTAPTGTLQLGNDLPAGLYFLRLQTAEGLSHTLKLVKVQ